MKPILSCAAASLIRASFSAPARAGRGSVRRVAEAAAHAGPIILLCMISLFLAGCETLPERVKARFEEVPPQTRNFAHSKREVFHAAQAAFKKLDWTVTRAAVADGVVEAASPINRNLALGDSRQLVARLEIEDVSESEAQVAMRLSGQVESSGSGGRSVEAIREHGFFERYFAAVEEVLQAQTAEKR